MKNPQPPQPESLPQPPPSPSAGSSAAADLEALALEAERPAAQPDDQAQPGAAAPAAPEVPTADFLAGMLAPAFDQLAPNWKVKPAEIKMLAVGWGAVLDHYFPGGVSSWGPWGVALAATAAVIGPRINVPPVAPPPEPAKP